MVFEEKLKSEVEIRKKKIEKEVLDGKRGSSYAAIRKLGDRPFEPSRNNLEIPEFVDKN